MIEITDKSKCNGCHACKQICSKHAIDMVEDDEGFLYPNIEYEKCIDCGLCEKICPEINKSRVSQNVQFYAAYRNDLTRRIKSASGGIFALIAEFILSQNGVVFGAAFDDKWVLKHTYIESKDNLECLLGSKYVQSKIGDSFAQAETFLKSGRQVLFCGTPCQIQGLKKYLMKEYINLFTIDLFCHGVPSPSVWQEYVESIQNNKKLVRFTQRDKSNGINNAPLLFEFDDGSVKKEKYSKNIFIKGFINNLYLRPSCYHCNFKGINRCSDITLGDFWGLEKFHPDFGDDFGVSAVLIHSVSGSYLFDSIKGRITYIESSKSEVTSENPCLTDSVEIDQRRETFFSLYKNKGLEMDKIVNTLTKEKKSDLVIRFFNETYHNIRHVLWVIKNKLF